MKVTIKATAATAYQVSSLSAFNIGAKKNGNGSFSGHKEFDSEEAAKEYLKSSADKYNDEDPEGTDERLADMYADIEHGQLTLDAVTAHIEEVE
jgi:hypothetical protein